MGCDPTITNDSGETAVDICKKTSSNNPITSKEIRYLLKGYHYHLLSLSLLLCYYHCNTLIIYVLLFHKLFIVLVFFFENCEKKIPKSI